MFKATFRLKDVLLEAYGEDESVALRVLECGWDAHVWDTGADRDQYDDEDVDFQEIELGICYRDGETLAFTR